MINIVQKPLILLDQN